MSTRTTVEILVADDPVEQTQTIAVAGFLAGYCGSTRTSYATDLRLFASWCHESGLTLFSVRRAHLELFGRWMEENGRMRSTVARRLSTLASFYRSASRSSSSSATRPSMCVDPRSTTSPAPLALTETSSAPFWYRPGLARLVTTRWLCCWR